MLEKTIPISQIKDDMFKLVDEISKEHKPIILTGEKNDAVLLSLEDWNAIQETLYLVSIPNMRESIIEGINTNIKDCQTKLVRKMKVRQDD